MNEIELHLHSLLALLSNWTELSTSFRRELSESMELQQVYPKQQLNYSGRHLNHAWFSIDCWVAAHRISEGGRAEVSAIYPPISIFTDISSFLRGETSHQQLAVISGRKLLRIDRQHFNLMRSHSETALLLEHYLLDQQHHNQWRLDLMSLSDTQKFNSFAAVYPTNHLPGNICASFLRMTPSRYSAVKTLYNRHR